MDIIASLRILRVAQILFRGNFLGAYLVPYLVARHLSAGEILQILAARQFVSIPLQSTTGSLADRYYGCKLSLLIGCGLCVGSMVTYAAATSWALMLVASLLAAAGADFVYGKDEALQASLYERLHKGSWWRNHEADMAKLNRRFNLVEALFCLCSTGMAWWLGLYAVLLTQGAVYAVMMALVIRLREPVRKKDRGRTRAETPNLAVALATVATLRYKSYWAPALAQMAADSTYQPDESIAAHLIGLGLVEYDEGGRLTPVRRPEQVMPSYDSWLAARRKNLALRRREGPYHVIQAPAQYLVVPRVKQAPPGRDGEVLLEVLAPAEFAQRQPHLRAGGGLSGGPWFPVKGPPRFLKESDHRKVIRRQEKLALWATVMWIGTVACLNAVTYRMVPLLAVERFHGLHGSDGLFLLGCLWAAYLLSVWVLGFGSGMLARVRGRWRLVVLGGLPLLGGLCYITFGLIASAVGLVAVLGLALMRAQEGALKTGLYNDVVNTDRRATVISAMMTVQNGMAAAVMLLAGRVVADHGLEAAMILIGGWHVLIGGVAVAVLGFSRFMGR